MYEEFKKIFDRFSFHETAGTEENDNKDESAQNAALSKKSDSDSEEEEQDNQQKEKGVSNKKKKLQRRMKIAELRQICLRPDVVEVHLKFTLGEEKTIVSSKITVFPRVEGKTNKDTNFSRSGLGWRDSDFGIVLVVWVLAVYNQIWAPGILGLTISRGAMMKLFDAHCHLQDPRILSKAPQLIAKAIDTGVVHFAVNGVSEKDWDLVKQMGENYPSVIPCFGLHPWYVAERTPSWFNTLKECLECTPSAAVGEIGLDKGSRGKEIDFTDQVLLSQFLVAQ